MLAYAVLSTPLGAAFRFQMRSSTHSAFYCMDLFQLETFLAVAEERSFSRAAARLHRTQPAVSQSIAKLEQELGEVLFERTSRDGTLTDAGEVLREYAQKLLNLRVESTIALAELRELHRGKLHLA